MELGTSMLFIRLGNPNLKKKIYVGSCIKIYVVNTDQIKWYCYQVSLGLQNELTLFVIG